MLVRERENQCVERHSAMKNDFTHLTEIVNIWETLSIADSVVLADRGKKLKIKDDTQKHQAETLLIYHINTHGLHWVTVTVFPQQLGVKGHIDVHTCSHNKCNEP